MKSIIFRKVFGIGLLAASVTLVSACTATPSKPGDDEPSYVYDKPIATVQKAAIDALSANGFDIKTSNPDFVSGSRPHKMGALVGSGGETTSVWLTAKDDTHTVVKVDTTKSLLGIAGQKSWNAEVIAGIDQSVGAHE